MTSRSYFGKMNSILGSVVPLAMFLFWKGTHPEDPLMSETVQEKKQERKAAKTLSFILLVFLITWTPYNVLAVMKAILGPEHEVIFTKL